MLIKNNSGQILLEGIISFLCSFLIIIGFIFFILYSSLNTWVDAETYTLARAHLYKNDLNTCKLSKNFKDIGIHSQVFCTENEVISEINLPESLIPAFLGRDLLKINTTIDLINGSWIRK